MACVLYQDNGPGGRSGFYLKWSVAILWSKTDVERSRGILSRIILPTRTMCF